MIPFHTYQIRFNYDGETEPQVRTFRAASPGHAQAKFWRRYPDYRPLDVWQEGGTPSEGYASTSYEIVSTAKVEPLPGAPKVEEQKFPFFNDCISHRPFRS